MTLNRRSMLAGQTDLNRLAVVVISEAVKGHKGWETFAFAADGVVAEEKSCVAAAMVIVANGPTTKVHFPQDQEEKQSGLCLKREKGVEQRKGRGGEATICIYIRYRLGNGHVR